MRVGQLKRVRVVISLLFFVCTTLLFLDFRNGFAPVASGSVLYPQFVPSLLSFVHDAGWAASGCLVVLVVTVVAGRVYCSSVCPLGTLQDIAGRLPRRNKRYAGGHARPHSLIRYTILALTILCLLAGVNLLINLLDPFSVFGRIITNLLRPVGIVINNGAAMFLENFSVYSLAREHWAAMAPLATGVAAATLVLVLYLACNAGRLYCNTLCPVGTLLGLVARFSWLRLRIDEESCTGCKRCEGVCKAGCIDLATQQVDMSRCVGCFNCLAVCKTDGIRYDWKRRYTTSTVRDMDPARRHFLFTAGLSLLALGGVVEPVSARDKADPIIQSQPTTVPVVRTSPVSPPGSVSVDHFTSHCTACHLCVSACPPQILLPSFLEYGLSGLLQPRMFFQTGHCNYECTICGEVCPAGAILPLTVEQKKVTQTGVAQFIKENCVVYTDNTACGACSEHCPTKAVNMVPYTNPLNKPLVIPEMKPDLCIGCGGCEHACPTKPYKAIFVDGNPVHKQAKTPVVQQVDQQVDHSEDFPF